MVERIKEKYNVKEDKWIPTEEAMRILGIKSKTTLQKLRDGESTLPSSKKGTDEIIVTLDSEDILIYPNPTSNIVNVMLPKGEKEGELTLVDINGRTITFEEIHDQTKIIDVSGLPSGIYLVVIKTKSQSVVKKLSIF